MVNRDVSILKEAINSINEGSVPCPIAGPILNVMNYTCAFPAITVKISAMKKA